MIDELQSRNEISEFFYTEWMTIDWAPLLMTNDPVVIWEGRPGDIPSVEYAYIRVTITPNTSDQASLAGADGLKKWSNEGLVSVQAFGPLSWDNGYEVAEYMGIMAKRVFQGKTTPNGIWFRNCRTNRIGPSGGWYQFNTLIEYQFDELR